MDLSLGKVKTDINREPFPKRKGLPVFSVFVVIDLLGRAFGPGNDGVGLFVSVLGLSLDLGHRRNGVALSDFRPVRPGHTLLCHVLFTSEVGCPERRGSMRGGERSKKRATIPCSLLNELTDLSELL